MNFKQMRLGGAGVVLASLALVLTACGDQSSGSASPGESAPDDAAAASSGAGGGQDGDGAYEGLCSWASPDDLDAIFGEPVDALGGKDCRVLPADETGSEGFYHVRLEQAVPFGEQVQRLVDNQASEGFTICDEEQTRVDGMRLVRRVTCPTGGGKSDGFQPQVALEVGPGRVLLNQPFPTDSEQAAQDASRRFVEIMAALAAGGKDQPVINEAQLGQWVEIFNPGTRPVDLTGFTVTGFDDFDEGLSGSLAVADGSTVPAQGRLVVDISDLEGTTGGYPMLELVDADGRMSDLADLGYADGTEVARRAGDGGPFCSFASAQVTRGKPNPATCD